MRQESTIRDLPAFGIVDGTDVQVHRPGELNGEHRHLILICLVLRYCLFRRSLSAYRQPQVQHAQVMSLTEWVMRPSCREGDGDGEGEGRIGCELKLCIWFSSSPGLEDAFAVVSF